MKSKLVFFDLETTGVDPYSDRIVEFAALVGEPGLEEDSFRTLVNPGVPIPAEATKVHGISNEDVRDAPRFEEIAEMVEIAVHDAVLIGYNSRRFDVPFLDAELRRVGRPGLPRNEDGEIDVPEIDLFEVWRQAEPRTLVSAAKRFAGIDHEKDAHEAEADVAVLPAVLWGMATTLGVAAYDEDWPDGRGGIHEAGTLAALRELTVPEWVVDRSGKFRRENGEIVFGFGKNEGEPVSSQRGYVEWMLSADFPPDTKTWCRRILLGRV